LTLQTQKVNLLSIKLATKCWYDFYFNEWNDSNLTTTIAYTYFSDRVNAIGTSSKGDLVDKAFGSLDFIAKSQLTEKE
jgi:hypothetical protein